MLTIFLSIFSFLMYAELSRALYRDAEKTLYLNALQIENVFRYRLHRNLTIREALLDRNKVDVKPLDDEHQKILWDELQIWERKQRIISRSLLKVRVIGLDGEIMLSNLKGWERDIIFPDFQRDSTFMEFGYSYQTIHYDERPVRLYYHLVKLHDRPLLVIQSAYMLGDIENTLSRLGIYILIGIPVAVFFACFAGWFLAQRLLTPVDNMTRQARRITAAYLTNRLPRTFTQDEIDRLAGTLNEMMDRIAASTRAVRDFSSDVSHELKTPLAIIRGELDLAFRKDRSKEELEKTLKVVEEETNEMIRLVNDLMILVRSDAKQLHLNKENILVSHLLSQLTERLQDSAKKKNVELKFEMDRDVFVEGDEFYLKHLFSNLIDNAIKFNDSGGKVIVSLKSVGSKAVVAVEDNGIGMDKETQQKIFSRFFRSEKARAREGSGLGMSIVKAIVDAHQAVITVDSELGKGTKMSVSLHALPMVGN